MHCDVMMIMIMVTMMKRHSPPIFGPARFVCNSGNEIHMIPVHSLNDMHSNEALCIFHLMGQINAVLRTFWFRCSLRNIHRVSITSS